MLKKDEFYHPKEHDNQYMTSGEMRTSQLTIQANFKFRGNLRIPTHDGALECPKQDNV